MLKWEGSERWKMKVFVMGINGLRDGKRRVVVEEKWKRWGEKVLATKEKTCCDGEERLKEGEKTIKKILKRGVFSL